MIAAGVDGCRAGWICVTREQVTGAISWGCWPDVVSLLNQAPRPEVIEIDVPIGLAPTGARLCDIEARRLLGPRRNSVFTAPLRPLLRASTWEDACAIRHRIEGKRISKQLWGIVPKIREVDEALRSEPSESRVVLREVHPELCFREWAGSPMEHPKKRAGGRSERSALVASHYGEGAFARVRGRYLKKHVADDDILDAFAALWTAERILAGSARTVPAVPPRDAYGLPMEMVV